MTRTTVKALEALVADLTKRVEALELRGARRPMGFQAKRDELPEYEGSVGGDLKEQHYCEDDFDNRQRWRR